MDKKALQLECRFSLPPNSLGYCGKDTAPAKFTKCILEGKCEGIEDEVAQFIVLYPYLKTISQITDKPVFSYEVIESYWLGNDLLRMAKDSHYEILLKNLQSQGVPDFFVEELREKETKKFIPSHLFHVLHIGVGKASGAVPFNIESINNCMIRWGRVEELTSVDATVRLNSLAEDKNRYELTEIVETLPLNKILPKLKVGDKVLVHWNMMIKNINEGEEKKLHYWTKQVLDLF